MISIRPAGKEDFDSIQRIFASAIRGLAKDHYTCEQIEVWAERLDRESFTASIEAGKVFVAEYDGEIAGFAQIDIPTGEVGSIYVSPEYAGRGIGSEMMIFVEDLASSHGVNSLFLRASLNAVPFYKKAGFVEEGEIVHQLDSTEFNCVIMRKVLEKH